MYNIELILKRLNIKYKVQGSNYIFRCINPTHEDKNPSMGMSDEGLYYCSSCTEGGNLHQFIKQLTGQSVYAFLNIDDPASYEFKMQLEAKRKKRQFSNIKVEHKFCQKGNTFPVHQNERVIEYLASIHMSTRFIRFFNVEYANCIMYSFLNENNFTPFYNRICIPVYHNKKLVNIIGRDYTGTSSLKELYPKGAITDTFFNIDNIDFSKPVIIVEGMKGLIRIWQHFNKNVMSSFGSTLGKRQKNIISSIRHLLLFVDNDTAGWNMADKIYELREYDFAITAMREKDYDPADGSIEELRYALRHPLASVDYFLRRHHLIKSKEIVW